MGPFLLSGTASAAPSTNPRKKGLEGTTRNKKIAGRSSFLPAEPSLHILWPFYGPHSLILRIVKPVVVKGTLLYPEAVSQSGKRSPKGF